MRIRTFAVVVCVLVGSVLVGSAGSGRAVQSMQDWPVWRGPLGTGVAPDGQPPLEWSETQNVAWKVAVPGGGSGTPIVWGDRIYLLTAIPMETSPDDAVATPAGPSGSGLIPGAGIGTARPTAHIASTGAIQRDRGRGAPPPSLLEFAVLAIDRADGSVAWRRTAIEETPHEGRQANNSWASASAVTDGEHLFAYFGSRGLYAYTLDGDPVWDVDFGDMSTRNSFGEGSTPALHGDTLVVTWDHEGPSFIVALDKATGEERWRVDRDEPTSWATPLIVEHEGRAQVITGATRQVRSYDLATGELLWWGEGLTVNAIPSPVAASDVVYLTSGYRGSNLKAVRLSARGDITGSDDLVWEIDRDTPYVPSPLLYGDNLYFIKSNSPIISNFGAPTGALHYGPQRIEGIAEIYASPVGAAGRVYIVGRDGNAVVLRDGTEYEVLARNSLDDGFDASPAIVGDEIYLRGYGHLYRISEPD